MAGALQFSGVDTVGIRYGRCDDVLGSKGIGIRSSMLDIHAIIPTVGP